ncbi:MAG: DUF5123 domain-containing protein [Prevotella sp.]|nr:DUF5123 domain-containing protein [Prevotella sp.]
MITKINKKSNAKRLAVKVFSYLLLLTSYLLASCTENANEWPIDPSYERLYRTTHFELEETHPTSVVLKFNGVIEATKYVFEFSLDSMQFAEIIRTEEVMADTLTPYSPGKTAVQTEYLKLFEDLYGTTRYSVRVKAVNENKGTESGWFGLSFMTPAEQIFTSVTPGITDVNFKWEADKTVSTLRVGQIQEKDTTWLQTVNLTADMQRAGETLVSDLTPGTNYIAQILNGEFLRGTWKFRTLGSAVGQTIEVNPGDDLLTLLTEATEETVTLVFTGGQEYDIPNQLRIPENAVNVYFAGKVVNGQKPVLNMIKGLRLSGNKGNICFQSVVMDDKMGEAYWFNPDKNSVDLFSFQGCEIRNIPRTLLYINNDGVTFRQISIDDCIINNVGTSGYGMLNIGKNSCVMETISITNSTLKEIGDQMMDLRCQIDLFKFERCIFCNYTTKLQKWIRADNKRAPKEAVVTNSIFCGPNGGQKMNHGYQDYSGWLEFSGCYLTGDFPEDSRKFTNAIHLDLTTDQLFEDPQNLNFHLKEGVTFKGKGVAGDPRWW